MFGKELDAWQGALACDLLASRDLDEATLNRAVRVLICRSLALRLCAGKGIDNPAQLLCPIEKTSRFPNSEVLNLLQHNIDTDGEPSDLGPSSDLPIEVLGQAYEHTLARTIRPRSGKRVVIEMRPERRRTAGIFYTPSYIVEYIVRGTVDRLVRGQTPEQVSRLRILDPACGAGAFLLRTFQYLLAWHRDWYVRHGPDRFPEMIVRAANGAWRLTATEKMRILGNNIFGADIDAQAVEVARLSLLILALEDATPEERGRLTLQVHLQCGNSLCDTPNGNVSPNHLFHLSDGHFDAVLGNPPYGALLSEAARCELARAYDVSTTDTAALFMLLAQRLTRPGGWNGFIVPKPFTYSTNWRQVRARLLAELAGLVDAGKVWPDVKLEQVIYFLQRCSLRRHYRSLSRIQDRFIPLAVVPKHACKTFDFLLNGVTQQELAVAYKMRSTGVFLGDVTANTRGGMLQALVRTRGPGLRVIGGKQIRPFTPQGQKGFLPDGAALPPQAFAQPGSILVQNIVAHIANPHDHIQIIGSIVSQKEASEIALLDTVNQLANRGPWSSHYLLALLSSRLVNWYVYCFIFARAIRTLHFDGPVSRRIPLPALHLGRARERSRHDRLVHLAKALRHRPGERVRLQQQIDKIVYRLYGLTAAETALVEGTASASFRRLHMELANAERQRCYRREEQAAAGQDFHT
jgi:N-6 DNA Methylase